MACRPALAIYVLLAVAVLGPARANQADSIIAAVKQQSQRLRGAASLTASSNGSATAEPIAGGGSLGVKGPQPKARRYTKSCGTQSPTTEELRTVQPVVDAAVQFEADERVARSGSSEARLLSNTYGPAVKSVTVYWHVIRSGPSYSQGNIPKGAINKQMAVLNQKFAPANISFNLAKVDYTTNSSWFGVQQGGATEVDMKTALHLGTMQDFNVYSAAPVGTGGEDIAGFTTLPMFSKDTPTLDGSTILFDTLPGGTQYGLNLGMTLVHEAGHWLGLLHVFDGGCDIATGGDNIGDTPYTAKASYDCTPKNSCPNIWGMDPIQNPMNYSPDNCMTTFTSQQYKRMRQQWYAFRSTVMKRL